MISNVMGKACTRDIRVVIYLSGQGREEDGEKSGGGREAGRWGSRGKSRACGILASEAFRPLADPVCLADSVGERIYGS